MLSFDTISFEAPFGISVLDLKKNHFRYAEKKLVKNVTEGIQEIYSIGMIDITGLLGMSRVEVDEGKDKITIGFSAKVLGKDYDKLNNENTILQSLEAINQNGCLVINPLKVLDTAFIHRIDVTKDISFDEICSPAEAIRAIKLVSNPKYSISRYDGGGITIRKDIKDPSAERLIFSTKQKS